MRRLYTAALRRPQTNNGKRVRPPRNAPPLCRTGAKAAGGSAHPELVGEEAAAGAVVIVADVRGDEVDACFVDEWHRRCLIDNLTVDRRPQGVRGARVGCSEHLGVVYLAIEFGS